VSEFHDPELERMLGSASGAYPDANVAFEVVRGRVRQVRRRRAMMASTATCALLVGVVAFAVRGGGSDDRVKASDSSTASSLDADVTTPETDATSPTTDVSTPTTAADTTVVSTMVTDSGSPGSPGGPGPNSGKGTKGTKPTTTTTAPSQVQPTVPHVDVQWYLSKGGSAGVQLVNTKMVLVGTSSATGFTAHVTEASGDRIRVEFTDGTSTYELQLQLGSDGTVTRSVQHKGA
jgi:hypothetical protein